jgi:hypothetical protein
VQTAGSSPRDPAGTGTPRELNLGHLELFEGNTNKAIDYYKKCIAGLPNVDEFMRRIDMDLELILSYGISKEFYDKIISEVVSDFKENHKKV